MLASGGRGTWTGGSWGHCSLEKCFWPRTEPGPQSHWVPAAGSPGRLGGSWGQGLSFPGGVLSRLSLGWGIPGPGCFLHHLQWPFGFGWLGFGQPAHPPALGHQGDAGAPSPWWEPCLAGVGWLCPEEPTFPLPAAAAPAPAPAPTPAAAPAPLTARRGKRRQQLSETSRAQPGYGNHRGAPTA